MTSTRHFSWVARARRSGAGASEPIADRVLLLGLAHELGQAIGMQVSIGAPELAPRDAYLVVNGPRHAPLEPHELRISPRTQDGDLPFLRKARQLCTDYNEHIAELRALAACASAAVERGLELRSGSAFSAAYFKLAGLDTKIVSRALATMAGGRLSLRVLEAEISAWKILDAQLAPIVHAADPRAASLRHPKEEPDELR